MTRIYICATVNGVISLGDLAIFNIDTWHEYIAYSTTIYPFACLGLCPFVGYSSFLTMEYSFIFQAYTAYYMGLRKSICLVVIQLMDI